MIILGVPIVLSQRPAGTEAIAATTQATARSLRTLRIVAFNTWDAVHNDEKVFDLVRQSDADVAILVEVTPQKRALLEMLRPLYPFQVHCAAIWACSMALVSRIPFEAQGTVQPNLNHAATVWGRIPAEGGGLTIVGVHIHRPTRSPRIHWGHIRGLAELTRSAKGALVVAGDFNSPSWSASMTWLRHQTGLKAMPRVLPTWPAWPLTVPQFPIDHILVSKDLSLENVTVGPASGSDHLPVIGTIRFARTLGPASAETASPGLPARTP